jgi:hypothetical protein
VRLVNARAKESSLGSLDGKVQGTRKNPHVIDAGLKQDLPVSYWCIMLMEISTMLLYEIYEQFVETV